MGFTPGQVDAMGLWEFTACCDGLRKANGGSRPQGGPAMSDEEYGALDDLGRKMGWLQ
jgi:hypothetical protein